MIDVKGEKNKQNSRIDWENAKRRLYEVPQGLAKSRSDHVAAVRSGTEDLSPVIESMHTNPGWICKQKGYGRFR